MVLYSTNSLMENVWYSTRLSRSYWSRLESRFENTQVTLMMIIMTYIRRVCVCASYVWPFKYSSTLRMKYTHTLPLLIFKFHFKLGRYTLPTKCRYVYITRYTHVIYSRQWLLVGQRTLGAYEVRRRPGREGWGKSIIASSRPVTGEIVCLN